MDLTISFEKIVSNFTRYHQYTLGSELRKKSWEIVGLIIKANSTVEKLPGEQNGDRQLFPKRESSLSTCIWSKSILVGSSLRVRGSIA